MVVYLEKYCIFNLQPFSLMLLYSSFFQRHIKNRHGPDYECQTCYKKFKNMSHINNHLCINR